MKHLIRFSAWLRSIIHRYEGLTIAGAYDLLRESIPDRSISIDVTTWSHHYDGRVSPELSIKFSIWDEYERYEGATLAEVVEKCKAGQSDAAKPSLTNAEAISTEVHQVPAPVEAPILTDDDIPF